MVAQAAPDGPAVSVVLEAVPVLAELELMVNKAVVVPRERAVRLAMELHRQDLQFRTP